MTFEEAMILTRTVSSPAAYEEEALRGLWGSLIELEPGSLLVEVGVECGRSTSLLLQVAKERKHGVILVDPFVDKATASAFMYMATQINHPFLLLYGRVCDLEWSILYELGQIDFLHLDGSHDAQDIWDDCSRLLKYIATGGFVCFHDYGGGGTPDVKTVADAFMAPPVWKPYSLSHTCAVFKKAAS